MSLHFAKARPQMDTTPKCAKRRPGGGSSFTSAKQHDWAPTPSPGRSEPSEERAADVTKEQQESTR